MPNEREILSDRVQQRVEELDRSARDVSMAAIGKPDLVRDIIRGKRMPTGPVMLDLARELQTTTDWLLGRSNTVGQVQSEVMLKDATQSWRGFTPEDPGIPLVGTGDCAEIEFCDETGELVQVERSSFDPDYHVRYLSRPPALRGARDMYAIQFHGESMIPRFEPDEVAIVDPGRPVIAGSYVLVQLRAEGEEDVTSVLAKRLVRQNSQEVTLQQFNPELTFVVPKSRVKRMHRIVPQTELLF